ncbi:MAG: DUF1465 family protein [Sphingobium sp.]
MGKTASLDRGLHRRLVDGLYVEAMVMADEARSYFDSAALPDDLTGDPLQRLAFACESLKVTTRLMHVIAWLLSQRAWQRGEIGDAEMREEKYRLGVAAESDATLTAAFPFAARSLVEASQELYERVARLQERIEAMRRRDGGGPQSPARALMDRLSTSF